MEKEVVFGLCYGRFACQNNSEYIKHWIFSDKNMYTVDSMIKQIKINSRAFKQLLMIFYKNTNNQRSIEKKWKNSAYFKMLNIKEYKLFISLCFKFNCKKSDFF